VIGLGTLALLSPLFCHGGALIDPLPVIYTILAAVAGAGVGIGAVIRLNGYLEQQPKRQAYAVVIGLPILLACCATYYVRLGVEALAFQAALSGVLTQKAVVTGTTRRFVLVRLEPGSRELMLRASAELRAAIDPYRSPGRDCILIDIETGRHGWRRTQLPTLFGQPFDTSKLVPCKDGQQAGVSRLPGD
jgi:hypothetical protein